MSKSPITCHVLDSTLGKPASGVAVSLETLSGASSGQASVLAKGQTDNDGRCTTLLDPSTKLNGGIYRMTFETGSYFAKDNRPTFYPRVEILFTLPDPPDPHYHIPLLLSPFSYTTYRGS
ncbi:Hydroxyisourate hydrolase [Meira miltonrushii]|uniref:5-hydroxyisourate hydrolase n=1 Tax=Meira miltonrushii TaxID=1280837 RepID=A0A316VFM5_9BASI|nr:Hydroxyisourate hydrolase [Meira miltonrushii]PWN34801.1 Hydroxyisourate hydrolase [Meira miltonrushii]